MEWIQYFIYEKIARYYPKALYAKLKKEEDHAYNWLVDQA